MPSNEDNKETEFSPKAKKEASAKGGNAKQATTVVKKKKQSFGWYIGVIVLILISITFVLPTTIVGSIGNKGITFGSYDGKKIVFEADQNNYFYNQYQTLAQSNSSNMNNIQGVYQVWQQAFSNTVFYTAINEQAKAAKLLAAPEVVDRTIRDSFQTENGEFDVESYSALSKTQRVEIKKNVENTLPAQMVISDYTTVLSSNAETDFVASMGNEGRSFNYVLFDATSYPLDKTKEYALSNPAPFATIEASIMTLDSEENANAALASIKSGERTFTDAASELSIDSFKSDGGVIGKVYYFQLESIFTEEGDIAKIFGAKDGNIVGPLATNGGYSLMMIDKSAEMADFDNEEDLRAVQAYLAANNADMIDSYIAAAADEFAAAAKEKGFEKAASDLKCDVVAVPATPQNVGNSQLFASFQYVDTVMYYATQDTDYYKSLYSAEEGTVLDPKKVSTAYVVTEVGANEDTSASSSIIKSYYPIIASNQTQSDLQSVIFGSDKFDNQFMTVFFDKIYTPSSSN
jgi:PPIC-type PPIASE domain.